LYKQVFCFLITVICKHKNNLENPYGLLRSQETTSIPMPVALRAYRSAFAELSHLHLGHFLASNELQHKKRTPRVNSGVLF